VTAVEHVSNVLGTMEACPTDALLAFLPLTTPLSSVRAKKTPPITMDAIGGAGTEKRPKIA